VSSSTIATPFALALLRPGELWDLLLLPLRVLSVVRLYYGSFKALLRLCYAQENHLLLLPLYVFRLYLGSIKAL
jgi:hypothetical protein